LGACAVGDGIALSQDFRKFEKKSKAGAGKRKLKKIPALRGKKSEIPGPSPQDLGIPIGQISSPSYASRTLAPSSQSIPPIYTQLPPQSAASKGGLGDR
jgi:hypothetical protein